MLAGWCRRLAVRPWPGWPAGGVRTWSCGPR